MARRANIPGGFTLIEMALVTIVMGILMMVLLPPIMQMTKMGKVAEGKEALHSLKDSIIGYAMVDTDRKLPGSVSQVHNTNDVWGTPYNYWRVLNATTPGICDMTSLEATRSRRLVTPGGVVNGTAFIISSNGPDRVCDITGAPATNGLPNTDMDLTDVNDDIVEYISVNQMKTLLGCPTPTGSDLDRPWKRVLAGEPGRENPFFFESGPCMIDPNRKTWSGGLM